jgi:peroxiredoxin Q/BCP
MTTRLQVGDSAPDFTLRDSEGHNVSLKNFQDQQVIIYFYPAAMTPGCTKQACDFRDSFSQWRVEGYEVIGISPDSAAKLHEFELAEELPFTLLSDPTKQVLTSYGAYGEKQLYGKTVVGVIRSTFVVSVDTAGVGTITHAWYNVKATGHVAKLRKDLKLP